MEPCEHYMVRTTFIKDNMPNETGRKTFTPLREVVCKHPNIDQVFGQKGIRKINCEGDDNKCLLFVTQKHLF